MMDMPERLGYVPDLCMDDSAFRVRMEQQGRSPAHPRLDPARSKARCQTKTLRTHGKVRDKIPKQREELYDHGNQGEWQAVKLWTIVSSKLWTTLRVKGCVSKKVMELTPSAKYNVSAILPI